MSQWGLLPREIKALILSYLDLKSLFNSLTVNKETYALATKEFLKRQQNSIKELESSDSYKATQAEAEKMIERCSLLDEQYHDWQVQLIGKPVFFKEHIENIKHNVYYKVFYRCEMVRSKMSVRSLFKCWYLQVSKLGQVTLHAEKNIREGIFNQPEKDQQAAAIKAVIKC